MNSNTQVIELLRRRLYETERKLPNRNYAKDHSYEEWREREGNEDCSRCVPTEDPNILTHPVTL